MGLDWPHFPIKVRDSVASSVVLSPDEKLLFREILMAVFSAVTENTRQVDRASH